MLIRFAVGNYQSFKDIVEFKMAAGKGTRHDSHVIVVGNGKRVLKGGFIFGANASGKSNLVRAINFSKRVVLKGANKGDCYKKYFRIENSYKDKPGSFQFDIYTGGHFYSYGFALSYQTAEIEEEWLYNIDSGEKLIFERRRNESGKIEIVHDIRFSNKDEESRFEMYSKDIGSDAMVKKTFLSDMALRSSKESECYKPFRDVRRWFADLFIIFPTSKSNIVAMTQDDEERLTLEQMLKHFDTGITALKTEEGDFDKVFIDMPEDEKALRKEGLLQLLGSEKFRSMINYGGTHYEIYMRNGDLKASEVKSNHGNPNDLFENKDESDGTLRLFDLLPLFRSVYHNSVIVIDELDRSLHSKATIEFINKFYEVTQGNTAQLIATTHETSIFDLDLLRQDEIWLVERTDNQASSIKPLSYYRPRFDKVIERDYLIGRYGAIPIFDRIAHPGSEDGG